MKLPNVLIVDEEIVGTNSKLLDLFAFAAPTEVFRVKIAYIFVQLKFIWPDLNFLKLLRKR